MLARRKAEEVAKRHSSGIVIGFDSVGWYKGSIMEKPRSKKEAYERLKSLSGKKHLFFTGIFMINIEPTQSFSSVARTKVIMRKLADSEILFYLDQDLNFMTYALGYCPWEYYSATFVKRIEGSYNNLLRGIPLEIVGGLLSRIGYVPKGNR
jgi:septum formation protein